MMTHAYDKIYLPDAMEGLGAAFDFATVHCGMEIEEFADRFIASGVARQIEEGNPTYLAGLSGIELAGRIVERTGGTIPVVKKYFIHWPGPQYWTGWILAYLQWYSGWSFDFLAAHGFDAANIFTMYHPYHEASEEKFAEEAVDTIKKRLASKPSALSQMRLSCGMTQRELAEKSGVKLRMIQAYEQRYQDISHAEAASVAALAKVLGCSVSTLLV